MRIKILFLLLFFNLSCLIFGSIKPVRLRCEYLENPMPVDVLRPRLSWINSDEDYTRGQKQVAYEIRVARSREALLDGRADLWNSGRVISDKSINILYEGSELISEMDCWWQVRVWDRTGNISEWSEPAFWSMGLLDPEDWKARWIGAPWQGENPFPRPTAPKRANPPETPDTSDYLRSLYVPAPMLRKSISLKGNITSARAYVTGLGFFEFYVNGRKVGNDVMVPNLTLYGKRDDLGPIGAMIKNNFREYRVMYLAYDLAPYLNTGENVLGAILGNGFYNPSSYWCQGYGTPRLLIQVHIKYSDGSEELVISDDTWKADKSPILMDQIYEGEHYDARREQPGWCSPGFNDSQWQYAEFKKAPEGVMKAHLSPTDRIMEYLSPRKITKLGEGHFRVDFGQEIAGWLHMTNIIGESGRTIKIKYICESAVGDNSYTLNGSGDESYSARFTWFVFREVEISNWPGELKDDQLQAEAVYSDIETTGVFDCSNPLFNKINQIWWRSQTDNMHGGIASDCPHRERSPYTGDGQVACVTVMHNFDARAFYTKWIRDIFGAQNPENGYVPNGAPWQPGCGGGVAWGAAINIMPWEFYLHYGDTSILKNNYEGMKGYIKYMLTWVGKDGIMFSRAPDSLNPDRWINLGEWVTPGDLPPDDMVHTFYLWRCADFTSKAAKVLGLTDDVKKYNTIDGNAKSAFQRKFFNSAEGSYGKYGGNIFALKMGVPAEQKQRVLEALRADIEANNDHLDTGIFGTQFLFEVLSENGLNELAYKIMNQRSQPGYGWWIEQGATTTWERWDGGGSHNHPMFGGGLTWLYSKLSGMNVDPEHPAYRNIIFKPQPPDEISFASYYNLTPYGFAGIRWERMENRFRMEVIVPPGSTATCYIPCDDPGKISEGGKTPDSSANISIKGSENGYGIVEISSGRYQFESYSTK
jgi:alpha-L-rhamnosidase